MGEGSVVCLTLRFMFNSFFPLIKKIYNPFVIPECYYVQSRLKISTEFPINLVL